jgi:hypothetical protein
MRKNIKDFALDQNKADRTDSIIAQSPIIKEHMKTFSRSLVNKIGNESKSLTGVIVDPNYPYGI